MFKKSFNIIKYLNLQSIGLLELLFAFTPMLMGFKLGPFPLSVLMWPVLIVFTIFRNKKIKVQNFRPLTCFIIYWFIHQLVLLLITDVNKNLMISQVLYFMAVYFLYPSLDVNKLRGAMNLVALISIAGLLFQWFDILRGNMVHPLQIPGLEMEEEFRMEKVTLRPSSFYMEPAAYVSYMICPLALSLIDKKFLWAGLIIFTMFLTTSTTGILLSFILLLVYIICSYKVKISSLIIVSALGIGMVYALVTFEAFGGALEKIENTEASTNVRLSQGPRVVASMQPEEYIFGVPYSTAYDYCTSGRMSNVLIYGESVYMSTFWDMILCYGIVGLILYLLIYAKLFRMSRLIWPLLACLCATLFSDPDGIKSNFVYKLIFMLVIALGEKQSYKWRITNKTR